MKYLFSEHWTKKAREIAQMLFPHVDISRISVIESRGTKTRRTIARIHTISKVMQLGMNQKPFYTIELITEKFNAQSDDDKIKTLIHELMHIPQCFGGGFRHHKNCVTRKNVEAAFSEYAQKIKNQTKIS